MSALMLPLALREWCSEEKLNPLGKAWSKNKILKVLDQEYGLDLGTSFFTSWIVILNGVKFLSFSSGNEGGSKAF